MQTTVGEQDIVLTLPQPSDLEQNPEIGERGDVRTALRVQFVQRGLERSEVAAMRRQQDDPPEPATQEGVNKIFDDPW